MLGIHLGISQNALEVITANENDKPRAMLLRWRNTSTSFTPYEDLCKALCHSRVGLNNVAKEFCKETTHDIIIFLQCEYLNWASWKKTDLSNCLLRTWMAVFL